MDTSPHTSSRIEVNGIHLHYLDWGGSGPVLLFLPGLGCNAHIFDRFAPRFTGRFHVLALTRRGHGESDHPEAGYDIDTLTEDIRQFLDRLGIDRVILAGHSLAGIELSHFAALHPARILKLVYLDAAFYRTSPEFKAMQEKNPLLRIKIPGVDDAHYSVQDYIASMKKGYPSLAEIWGDEIEEQGMHEITIQPDGRVVDRMSEAILKAIQATLNSYEPEDALIQAPTLSFTAFPDADSFISRAWMTAAEQAQVREFFATTRQDWLEQSMQQFRRNVPHARIVPVPHGHHYCFIKDRDLVFDGMMKFLLE
jgi:pimeloyl-ACP methyl ester carboxylesterase